MICMTKGAIMGSWSAFEVEEKSEDTLDDSLSQNSDNAMIERKQMYTLQELH